MDQKSIDSESLVQIRSHLFELFNWHTDRNRYRRWIPERLQTVHNIIIL